MLRPLKSKPLQLALAGAILASCALIGGSIHALSAPGKAGGHSSRPVSQRPFPRETGRYQLQDIHGVPYLLDTATGRVWFSHAVDIPGKYSDFTADGRTKSTPVRKNIWTEDSPDWARGR